MSARDVLRILAVFITLSVDILILRLEGEAGDCLSRAVEDDALVDGFGAHDVFHTANDLEAVFVELASGGNGCEAEAVLDIVLQHEGSRHLSELKVVVVLHGHLHCLLDGQEVG